MTVAHLEEWRETNRVVLGYGDVMPPLPHGGRKQWRGCRGITQYGEMCSQPTHGNEVCAVHRDHPHDVIQPPGMEEMVEPVYFVAGGGLVKIGKGPVQRARSHQTSSPVPLKVLRCLRAQPNAEFTLHYMFTDARVHGEWFRWTPRLRRLVFRLSDDKIREAIGWVQNPEGYRAWYDFLGLWSEHRGLPMQYGEHPICAWARSGAKRAERPL